MLMSELISDLFFFFKQKTAYELRSSDGSSDVCSSDLDNPRGRSTRAPRRAAPPCRCCSPRCGRATTTARCVPPSVFPSPPWSRDRAASLVREREQNRSFQATARQACDHEGAHEPASPSLSPAAWAHHPDFRPAVPGGRDRKG